MKALNLTGQPVDLNVAGIHGTSDIKSKRLRVKIGDQDGKVKEDIMAHSHPNVNAGNRSYDLKKVKETYPHLSVLKDSTVNLRDAKVVLGQDCYHLHRAIGYRKCGKSKPWAVLKKLGWMLSGPLPQEESAKLATERLFAAELFPLAGQMKTQWSMGLYALNCSVSGRFEGNKNSPDIFVVERNWQEVSTKTLLVDIKQVCQEEMQLVAGNHIIVKQEGPVTLREEVMMQRDSFGKCVKESVRQLEVNDSVWILDENVKRAHYKMARVLEVYHGSHGRVRSALVKTEDGKLKRPVVKLAP